MTTPDTHSDVVARELEQLGERPLGADELLHTQDDPDVRTVQTLLGLSEPQARGSDLTALDRRRVWRKVAASRPDDAPRPTRPHAWRSILVGLSVAAGVALMARPRSPAPASTSAALDDLAVEARRGLESLEGPSGAKRAQRLAQEYGERLEEQR